MATGTDLKVRRVAARVSQKDLAYEYGVTAGRLSKIEGPELVTLEAESRYLAALSKCITKSTRAAA